MIRHDDESNQSSGTCYTLYLEFLGGLVPLLKGKRTSKIRPEFVIFDPQIDDSSLQRFVNFSAAAFPSSTNDSNNKQASTSNSNNYSAINGGHTDSSESDFEEGCRKCFFILCIINVFDKPRFVLTSQFELKDNRVYLIKAKLLNALKLKYFNMQGHQECIVNEKHEVKSEVRLINRRIRRRLNALITIMTSLHIWIPYLRYVYITFLNM